MTRLHKRRVPPPRLRLALRHTWLGITLAILAVSACLGDRALARPRDPVTVFAASSMTEAVQVIAQTWEAEGHPPFRLSFASSSVLARQIAAGAPADLFISADRDWMNELIRLGLVAEQTVVPLASNTLVLVGAAAPGQPCVQIDLTAPGALAACLGRTGRLAIGDPDHVPAGRYAKEALISLGHWPDVWNRLARAENVRAALALAQRGEAPLAIVYGSDARLAPDLRVLAEFAPSSHAPIIYPVGLTVTGAARGEAREVAALFLSAESAQTLSAYGFSAPGGEGQGR